MRILYIVNTYPSEKNPAAEPFVKAQIDSVIALGHDVDVVKVKEDGTSSLNYLKKIFAVRQMVREKGYDIVHGHYVYSGWIAALQGECPSVVSFMGSDLYGTLDAAGGLTRRGRFDMWLCRTLQPRVTGVIVKSQEMFDMLTHPEKSIVLPNGVDFNVFREVDRIEACKRLELDPDIPRVLFVGDHTRPRKSFVTVEKAVDLLRRRGVDCELLVAHRISHDLVPYYMGASDAMALASYKEGSPNVVKEALACNLPVVSTDVGDVAQVIQDASGCYLAERTPEDFADKLAKAIEDGGSNGRHVIDHLRSEKVAGRLVDFYGACIKAYAEGK